MSSITLSQSIRGYMLAANARRLSRNTLEAYAYTYRRLQQHLGHDPALASIDVDQIRAYLNSLAALSPKSVRNHHTALSALWTWAVREDIAPRHIVRDITPPKPASREIVPYTRQDLKAMLAACDRTAGYARPGKAPCDNARPTALRDRAMITLLVDTGIRASELCDLQIWHCDLKNQRITVMGKGRRERVLPISARTAQVIWRYLATREDAQRKASALFITSNRRKLERNSLRRLLQRTGQRAGVLGVNVHRFRHTFAIAFLRNGGHVFALQRILGHSTMEMVRRYLSIADSDVQHAHRDASPVQNWLL
jgi:site-specific recombinase XerD